MSTDLKIIRALREAWPEGIAGTDMATRLGLTRGAIWARMDILRSAGFEIEASPHHGYRLLRGPDNLIGDDIASQLKSGNIIGRSIQVYKETTSTNEVAEKLARSGVSEGAVVFAEKQLAGRGRLGRKWECPGAMSLLFSILLRPQLAPAEVARLTLMASCSIAKSLQDITGQAFQIKWPNDVHFKGKKVAGILTELRADMDRIQYVILGAGINILQRLEDFPETVRGTACSLAMICPDLPPRSECAARILDQLDRDLIRSRMYGFEESLNEWKSLSSTLGQWITLRLGDQTFSGQAESIDENGCLWMRGESGKLMPFHGGEVTTQKDLQV